MDEKEFSSGVDAINPIEVEDSVLKQEEASKSLKFRPVTNDTIAKKYDEWRKQNRTPKEVKEDIKTAVDFSNALPENDEIKSAVNERILLLTSEYVFLKTDSLESAQILGNRAIKLNEAMKKGVDLSARLIMEQVNQDIRDNNVKFAAPANEDVREDFSSMVDNEIQENENVEVNDMPDTSEQFSIEEDYNPEGDLIGEEAAVSEEIEIPSENVENTEVEIPVPEAEIPERAELEEESEEEYSEEAVEPAVVNEEAEEESYSEVNATEDAIDGTTRAQQLLMEADERYKSAKERKERGQSDVELLRSKRDELLAKIKEVDDTYMQKVQEKIAEMDSEAEMFAREADELEQEKSTLAEFNDGQEEVLANREKFWQELFEKDSLGSENTKGSK